MIFMLPFLGLHACAIHGRAFCRKSHTKDMASRLTARVIKMRYPLPIVRADSCIALDCMARHSQAKP